MVVYLLCKKRRVSTLTLRCIRQPGLIMQKKADGLAPLVFVVFSGYLGIHFFIFVEGKTIEYLVNDQIRDKEVRVIGAEGGQLGVMSIKDAQKLADEAEMDLVRVSPNAKPPVCKIVDYGKFRYEMSRKEKDAKKKQRIVEIKEVRLSPNIEENDLNTKVSQARKFLEKGNRVKVTLRFRGRELAYVNQSKRILDEFAEKLSDISVIDKPAKFEGRSMTMFLAEKKS